MRMTVRIKLTLLNLKIEHLNVLTMTKDYVPVMLNSRSFKCPGFYICPFYQISNTHVSLDFLFIDLSGLVSSIRRALASKLRGPGFKSRPDTVSGPVTIIMCGARTGWKLALS